MNPLVEAIASLVENAIAWRVWLQPSPYPDWVIASMIEQELSDAAA